MNAWAAATYLVKRGVPSRLAHEQIGKAVQLCIERNCELQDLPLEELQVIKSGFRRGFLRVSEAGFGAGNPRRSRRNGARPRAAGDSCGQEKN